MELPLIFVRPARPGLIVLMPDPPHDQLPAAGASVPKSPYWLRRLRSGDVAIADPATAKE